MQSIVLKEPYAPRPIRFLELWEPDGWRIKVYGIAYRRERPDPELVEAAKKVARERLSGAAADRHYGVGFLGVHQGRGADWVFVDWWADENELHQHVYISPPGHPEELVEVTATGVIACVWDLRVMCFERGAWVEQVLANPAGPDVEGYLACRLNEDA